MDIVYSFDVVGGLFDGAPGFMWLDDGKAPPPDLILVGVCRTGRHCGSQACKRAATHVSFWLPDEEGRPPDAMPYPKENEYVVTDPKTKEVAGRAVYAIGGLRDPQNFGDAAREPVEVVGGVESDPLVTAEMVREAWAGEGRHVADIARAARRYGLSIDEGGGTRPCPNSYHFRRPGS